MGGPHREPGGTSNGGQFKRKGHHEPDVTLRGPGSHSKLLAEHGQRVVDSLEDMLSFADLATNIISQGRDSYDADINLRLAGEAVCHRMGEAAARLLHHDHEHFILTHPDVDWAAIRGLRNVVAHQYERVNHRILWNALAVEFPADAAKIRAMLDE